VSRLCRVYTVPLRGVRDLLYVLLLAAPQAFFHIPQEQWIDVWNNEVDIALSLGREGGVGG